MYDGGSPPLATTVTVVINIDDINDNAPVFEKSSYEVPLGEGTSPGETILTVVAIDIDQNDELTYQITGGNINGTFRIDSKSNLC